MTSFWCFFQIPICAQQSVVRRLFCNVMRLPQSIVAMISSNLARCGHPSRVFVACNSPEGKAAGLRLDSVIMTDNLATILDTEMDSLLGRFPAMKSLDAALKHTLGLE